MDTIGSREIDVVDDLESGDTSSTVEEESMQRDWDEVAGQNESMLREKGLNHTSKSKSSFISGEGVKIMVGDVRTEAGRDSMGRKLPGEKNKKKGSKRPPKPPRPPGGPSLNAADIKLLREISELSSLRRERHERIKALQKKRSEKASSSTSNVFAMIVTVLFICVIIFQGILGSHV